MTDILAQGRAMAERYNSETGGGFQNTNRLNAYECDGERGYSNVPAKQGCGSFIVTIDRHPGVTPFMVRCGNCGQMAHSKGYRVQDYLNPTHEWYRPETLDGIDERSFDHLANGGLILRAIPGKPDRWTIPVRAGPCDPPMSMMRAKMDAERQALDNTKAEHISRQVARRSRRKGQMDPPAEIQMYGATYRIVQP